ncbi:MAG: inositol monophosphatase family protein, partial [Gammaproteobacteria bacterium]
MTSDTIELEQTLIRTVDAVLARMAGAQVSARTKSDGSIVTAVDHALQEALSEALRRRWPEVDFLGEEMAAERQRDLLDAGDKLLWCLDPLDGTTNYAAGVPFYSVSLARLENGRPAVGIVYDPERRECFAATRGARARLNGQPLQSLAAPESLREAVALVDFKRLPSALAARLVQEQPYRSQRNFGSCALEWCWLAAGRAHVYLHGGMRLWDHAAGSLILEDAGGTLDGARLEYC